ncbi:MAG: immune inhibitor A, partial [Candidatus Krumholzibacteria bacterium]|nr:immune inhibitor A [Candidatus Krumholzibacteria bacterium]
MAGVPNTGRDPASGFHTFTVVDYYAYDFEASNGGFVATGPDWEWGAPTLSTGPAGAHSGVNLWGTKLAANYSNSSNSKLDLPPLQVPSSKAYATLSFWQWYSTENTFDGGNVKISTNGGTTWTILTPDIGYKGTASSANAGIPGEPAFMGTAVGNFWHKVTINLTAYKGQTVIIRFHFGSDSSVNYPGWYIDDVRLEGVDDTAPPVFVSTTVPTSTWDIVGPYVVKSKIVDALSGVGSVSLHYSTNDGASWGSVAMTPTTPPEYSGTIPGQPSGTTIKVYVSATDVAANTGTDPATAPAAVYQFTVLLASDYLVILGGGSNTPAQTFIDAFAAIGKTCDVWNWDSQGLPTVGMLNAFDGVIVDESSYFDANQTTLLTGFLAQNDGTKQQIVFWGRDMSYGASARPFMEQFTGMAYVKDDPGTTYRWLWSVPGDPIGNGEKFSITGSYPDELKLSTTYPGAQIIYKYHLSGTTALGIGSEEELLAYYYKEGKEYDGVWPMAPSAPDSAAAGRYVGTYHASVYFAFQFNYITDSAQRAAVLGRALTWLTAATEVIGKDTAMGKKAPVIPDRFTLSQNYPNPFNPVTTIEVGVPAGFKGIAELRIFNVKGELVKTLHNGAIDP